MSIGIVDYNAGNLRSVETAMQFLKTDYIVSDNSKILSSSDKLIFPGVGEASAAMKVLKRKGLDKVIIDFVHSGKPLLGICLGCQIILDYSEESDTRGLGIIPGIVKMFKKQAGLKIPHMGWNQVIHRGKHPVFAGIPKGASFYFVHSYYPEPSNIESTVAWTEYGINFSSAIAEKNVIAVQFHPEKSGKFGLKLLQNFITLKDDI